MSHCTMSMTAEPSQASSSQALSETLTTATKATTGSEGPFLPETLASATETNDLKGPFLPETLASATKTKDTNDIEGLCLPQTLTSASKTGSEGLALPQTLTSATKGTEGQSLFKKFATSLFGNKKCPKPPVPVPLSCAKHRHVDVLALKFEEGLSTPRWSVEAMYTSDNDATRIELRLTPLCPGKGRFTQIELFVGLRDQHNNTVIPIDCTPRSPEDPLMAEVTTSSTQGVQATAKLSKDPELSGTWNGQGSTTVKITQPSIHISGAPISSGLFCWILQPIKDSLDRSFRCQIEMQNALPVNAEYRLVAQYHQTFLKVASVPPRNKGMITIHLKPS